MSAHRMGSQYAGGAAFDLRLFRRLWRQLGRHRRLIWVALALLLVASACRLTVPWLVRTAIDLHLVPGRLEGFHLLLGALAGVALLEFAVRRWQMFVVDLAGQNGLFDLRQRVFAHLQRLPASFFDRTPIGKLVGRVTTDVEALQEMFSQGVVTILNDLLLVGATLAILLAMSWKLTLVCLVIVPALLAVTFFVRIRVRAAYVKMRSRTSRVNAYLHEQISGMPVVQMFTREERSMAGFQEINGELRDAQLATVRWESCLSAAMEMLGNFTVALIAFFGGRAVIGGLGPAAVGDTLYGGLSLGTLFAFVMYMQRFFQPLNELSMKYTVMQNAMTASDRIFSLLDQGGVPVEPDEPFSPERTDGRIEFRRVSFGYDPARPVLREIGFTLEPGERVAIVGATGAGKTTLLKLLTRLYELEQGEILLDGVDVRRLALQDLRRRVGVVTQDVFLFEGDILSNIRLGLEEIGEEEARAAADRLHLDRVVSRFPGGYRERVQERGKNLSAGEKQLISFARVLARQPAVLALDEATSNVDSATEHLLQEAVHQLMLGRTSLIIAHRLSTIRDVDRILVLHKGRLVEEGTHAGLLARRGIYWRLYQLQYQEQEPGGGG